MMNNKDINDDINDDELMKELEKDIEEPDMFTVGYNRKKFEEKDKISKNSYMYNLGYEACLAKYNLNEPDDYVTSDPGENTITTITKCINEKTATYLCIGDFRIELDDRTPVQKAKARYYLKKKSMKD